MTSPLQEGSARKPSSLDQQGIEAWQCAIWIAVGGVFGAKIGLRWALGLAGIYLLLGAVILAASIGLSVRQFIAAKRLLDRSRSPLPENPQPDTENG